MYIYIYIYMCVCVYIYVCMYAKSVAIAVSSVRQSLLCHVLDSLLGMRHTIVF